MPTNTKLFTVTGTDELVANVRRIEEALIAAAPKALEDGAKPALDMMRRLVPKDTGQLARTIRFSLGAAEGAVKFGGKKRASQKRGGRHYIVGYIVAGDETTIKKGSPPGRLNKAKTKRAKPAKGWQLARLQEFGTVKMKPHPFFYPSWRSQSARVRTLITLAMNRVFKAAGGKKLVKEAA